MNKDRNKPFKRGYAILKKMGHEKLMLDRQLVTLAANIALARPRGNYSHYRSAIHLGITKKEICESIIQVAHHAGWPTLSLANHQFSEVLKQPWPICLKHQSHLFLRRQWSGVAGQYLRATCFREVKSPGRQYPCGLPAIPA